MQLRLARRLATAPRDYRPFVIATLPRSGSNNLVDTLGQHPDILAHNEILNSSAVRFQERIKGGDHEDAHYLDTHPLHFLHTEVWPRDRRPAAAVGFKLMHGDGVGRKLAVWPHLRAMPDLHVILLQRHDLLERFVSMARARRDDVWFLPPGEPYPVPQKPLHLDPREVLIEFEHMALAEDLTRRRFADHAVLEVSYEDLFGDRAETLRRIHAFLGVEHVAPEHNPSQRVAQRPISEEVDNLRELAEAARGTRWAQLIDRHLPD